MYCREKPPKEDKCKPRKGHRNTASFSSTLLDEIYRSIDAGNAEKGEECKQAAARHGGLRSNEHVARPCLVEKWMMEKESNKTDEGRRVRQSRSTLVSPEVEMKTKNKEEDDLMIKSRSRAYKVYARLKKMKQPISPGGRLTTFLNSLFTNNPNKSKKQHHTTIITTKGFQDLKPSNNSKVSFSSSSSSSTGSSFSRSCPSRYSSESGDKKMRSTINEPEITRVGFHPTAVIYGGDHLKPRKSSIVCGEDSDYKYGRPPLPPNAVRDKNRGKKNREADIVFRSYQINQRKSDFSIHHQHHHDDDDDDGISDSSSDLFELDHLGSFGDHNSRFSEELPVYGTTYYNGNHHRIVGGLFR